MTSIVLDVVVQRKVVSECDSTLFLLLKWTQAARIRSECSSFGLFLFEKWFCEYLTTQSHEQKTQARVTATELFNRKQWKLMPNLSLYVCARAFKLFVLFCIRKVSVTWPLHELNDTQFLERIFEILKKITFIFDSSCFNISSCDKFVLLSLSLKFAKQALVMWYIQRDEISKFWQDNEWKGIGVDCVSGWRHRNESSNKQENCPEKYRSNSRYYSAVMQRLSYQLQQSECSQINVKLYPHWMQAWDFGRKCLHHEVPCAM